MATIPKRIEEILEEQKIAQIMPAENTGIKTTNGGEDAEPEEPKGINNTPEKDEDEDENRAEKKTLGLQINVPRNIINAPSPANPRQSSRLFELIKEDSLHVARRNDEYGFIESKRPSPGTTWE